MGRSGPARLQAGTVSDRGQLPSRLDARILGRAVPPGCTAWLYRMASSSSGFSDGLVLFLDRRPRMNHEGARRDLSQVEALVSPVLYYPYPP